MQVGDAVARIRSDLADDAIAACPKTGLLGDPLGGLREAAEQLAVSRFERPEVLEVALSDHGRVQWRLGGAIGKSERLVVLGEDRCRRPRGGDPAERARAQRVGRRDGRLSWRRGDGAVLMPRRERCSGRSSTAR